ncbi:MAG: hypothetical protein IPQ07_12945 [Myxococcales bacterium]|nr:hypothetical protein [Myxococcales bacterium]
MAARRRWVLRHRPGRIEVESLSGRDVDVEEARPRISVWGLRHRLASASRCRAQAERQRRSHSHYAIGARAIRIPFGEHAVAFGVGTARKYRRSLRPRHGGARHAGRELSRDLPERRRQEFAATPTISIFVSDAFLFLLDAGPIATNANFSYAKTLAFEGAGGADIMLTRATAWRIAAELSQVGFEFKNSVRA